MRGYRGGVQRLHIFEDCSRIEEQHPEPIPPETEASQEVASTEERRLIAGVLAKDRKATGEFVAPCADWLYPFVRNRLVPRDEGVEDLIQEIVFAAWQALPSYRGDANLRSWIIGIAGHKVADYYRKKLLAVKVHEEDDSLLEPTVTPEFEEQIDSAALRGKVQQTLASLPEAYALALMRRYRDEKTVREMAQLVGKTEKAMERLLARARQNFRKRWTTPAIFASCPICIFSI
jgi:RNA polymerase sigma-70 factor, ECF subfamily